MSAEAKFTWIMPNRCRFCGTAQQWRTINGESPDIGDLQGECRSQVYLDYAEPTLRSECRNQVCLSYAEPRGVEAHEVWLAAADFAETLCVCELGKIRLVRSEQLGVTNCLQFAKPPY